MFNLTVAQITLPVLLPAGVAGDPHADLRNELCRSFGGFTRTEGFGGWVDDQGNTVTERVYIYTVGIDMKLAYRLPILAAATGRAALQDAMYLSVGPDAACISSSDYDIHAPIKLAA